MRPCEVCGDPTPSRKARFCTACLQHQRQLLASARRKHEPTPEIDAVIRRAWTGRSYPKRSTAVVQASGVNWPGVAIRKRARQLGLSRPQRPDHEWTRAELRILDAAGHLSPESIRARLHKAGYSRTLHAVQNKRKILRREGLALGDGWYTTPAAAEIFGVDSSTFVEWIRKGYIAAKRRSKSERAALVVNEDAIRQFVAVHPWMVDLKKIAEPQLFLEIVTGGVCTPRAAVQRAA